MRYFQFLVTLQNKVRGKAGERLPMKKVDNRNQETLILRTDHEHGWPADIYLQNIHQISGIGSWFLIMIITAINYIRTICR